MVDLRERLARDRAALVEEIDQPPLARIEARGAAIRRRRRRAQAGVAVAVLALALVAARPWEGSPPPQRPAQQRTPSVDVYRGGGITLNGLELPVASVPDLPGVVVDAQFPDPDHGFVITSCGCRPGFARTADGGRTWISSDLPDTTLGPLTRVIAFDARNVVISGRLSDFGSDDGGITWHQLNRMNDVPLAAAGKGEILRLTVEGDRVAVWGRDGIVGTLARQPDSMVVTWVAAQPTATGDWWVGGHTAAGKPAISVTADRGHTWKTTALDGGAVQQGAASVQVSALGSHLYAAVLGADRRLVAVYHSADVGRTFTHTGPTGAPLSLAGEMVPLLDGRLLLTTASHGWWTSADDGRTFARPTGDLPSVGPLARTAAGYVAYQLFSGDAGWLALSPDGAAWRKLQIH